MLSWCTGHSLYPFGQPEEVRNPLPSEFSTDRQGWKLRSAEHRKGPSLEPAYQPAYSTPMAAGRISPGHEALSALFIVPLSW